MTATPAATTPTASASAAATTAPAATTAAAAPAAPAVPSEPRTHWSGAADAEELARWGAVAERVAAQLAVDALERDRAGADPFDELDLLRESGLVTLLHPARWGGGGGHWESAFLAVRILARADASIAQVLAYHYINSAVVAFNLPPAEQEGWYRRSVAGAWVWGDSVNPVDPDLELSPDGEGGYVLTGLKRFSTGASVGDITLVNARITSGEHEGRFLYAALERGRTGVEFLGDWDALGQRLSASGSVRFTGVRVRPEDSLGLDRPDPFASLVTPGIQLAFGNLYLGIAEGALARGIELLRARPRAWFLSAAETYSRDPYTQRVIGEFAAQIAAVEALAERTNRHFDRAIARGAELTARERGETEIAVATLKIASDAAALEVSHRIFEVTGSSSATAAGGLDLYWRNIRTHSLHDPVDYKKFEVGAHALHGEFQPVSLYT